jgi:hypothetical protein
MVILLKRAISVKVLETIVSVGIFVPIVVTFIVPDGIEILGVIRPILFGGAIVNQFVGLDLREKIVHV